MYYHDFMTYTVSISSRGLVYFPEELQKKLKLKKPGKITVKLLEGNKVEFEPVKDIMEFAGKGKDKAHLKIWENFRDKMETEYEDIR